jgi:tmRNA-binding protein
MWAWQSDKNHLDNIAKKEKKIAKWTWQFGKMDLRKKQVKSIRQKYPRKIYSITPKQIYHFGGGIIINGDTFWNSKKLFDKRAYFHLMCEFMTKITGI